MFLASRSSRRYADQFGRFVPRTKVGSYALAVVLAVVGAVVQFIIRAVIEWLDPAEAASFGSYQTFMAAVALSAILCGRHAAFLCLGLSAVLQLFLFISPVFRFDVDSTTTAVQVVLFLIVGTLICLIASALHESRQEFDAVVSSISDAVVATDESGSVTFSNRAAEILTGWPSDEGRGQRAEQVLTLVDEAGHRTTGNLVTQALRVGRVATSQQLLVARSGAKVPVELAVSRILNRDKGATGVVLVLRDMSALHTGKRLLQESEDRLRLAIDSTELGAFDYYPQTGELIWSVFAKRHFGLPPDAGVTYDTFRQGLHPDDRERVEREIEAALRGETGGRSQLEYRTIGIKDREARWLAMWGRVFFDAAGAPARFVGITSDITTRKHAEQALLEADRRKTEFLAMLAHELRNPLAPIRFAVKMLEGQPRANTPEAQRALSVIDRQIAQLVRLIDDLLDVSRITQNKIQLRIQRVDLADVMRSAVEASAPIIEAAGHTLRVGLPDVPVALEADSARLVQVYCNLLNNASKFTPQGGVISFVTSLESSKVSIRVIDTGIGIASESLPHVFDMFRQEDASLERRAGGLGIGLTLAKTLVEMHGGSIEARSAGAGAGAEFVVTLPAAAPVAHRIEPAPPTRAKRTGGLRVLIVDDNADAAEMMEAFTALQGHATSVAHEAASALALAESFRPDVMLLDIGLPGRSGYDVARAVRERYTPDQVYLVAVTGWGQEEDRRRARDAGFDFHLTKPVDPSVLEHLLDGIAHTIQCDGCERCVRRARTRAADAVR